MKKSVKAFLAVCAVVVLSAVLLCGCGSSNGLSAYEIAVKNGFAGSETEWLQSLQTEKVVTQNNVSYVVDGATGGSVVAANIGLKSVVSVYSNFTKVVLSGGWFNPQQQKVSYTMAGAGVFFEVESDGSAFIVTNHHVVYDSDSLTSDKISDEIYVLLYGMENTQYAIPATYVGGSMYYDLAVLRVEKSSLLKSALENGTVAAAQIADSEKTTVGQTSVAIGNPAASGISVSSGIISVDSEYITMTAVDNKTSISLRVTRTDTAVNSGNSGGGLFDSCGNLIGIVNAKMNTSTAENIAYAIPSNLVRAVANNIIDNCFNTSCKNLLIPSLGVETEIAQRSVSVDESGALRKTESVKITSVAKNSVLYGKLSEQDVILGVTVGEVTTQVTKNYLVSETLLNARAGDEVRFEVLRNGKTITVEVTLTSNDFCAY